MKRFLVIVSLVVAIFICGCNMTQCSNGSQATAAKVRSNGFIYIGTADNCDIYRKVEYVRCGKTTYTYVLYVSITSSGGSTSITAVRVK